MRDWGHIPDVPSTLEGSRGSGIYPQSSSCPAPLPKSCSGVVSCDFLIHRVQSSFWLGVKLTPSSYGLEVVVFDQWPLFRERSFPPSP